MSIQITFYKFEKKVNSTKLPTTAGITRTCDIKAPMSILEPRLEIVWSPIQWNYCYIPAFNRYYFIQDITFDKGIWIVSCTVDVLASYKSEIGAASCYILRSSASSDGDIVDTKYPMTTSSTQHWRNPDINAFQWNGFNNGWYVVGLQGNNDYSVNGSIYYQLTPTEFAKFLKNFYANSSSSWWGNIDQGIINSLNKINDYITSCRWYPSSFTIDATARNLIVGGYDTGAKGYIVKENPLTVLTFVFNNIPKHPKAAARGNYLNSAPYSRYVLRSGVTGTIALDPFYMKGCTNLAVEFFVDVTTGQAKTWVMADGTTFVETYGQFGVDVNLNGTEINIGGAIGNAMTAVGSIAVGDYVGALASVGNGIAALQPQVVGKASSGGYVQFYQPLSLLIDFYDIVDDDNAIMGRPLCAIDTPANLGGFMIVQDPNIEIAGTSMEANQINTYMTGGFFYE